MQPPPNCATSENVCASPPRLTAVIVPPASSDIFSGEKRHAGADPFSRSWPMNLSNVTPPFRTQASGSCRAALKLGPSQASSIWTCRVLGPAQAIVAAASAPRARAAVVTSAYLLRILPSSPDAPPGRRRELTLVAPLSQDRRSALRSPGTTFGTQILSSTAIRTKKPRTREAFRVAGAGFEPATSGL